MPALNERHQFAQNPPVEFPVEMPGAPVQMGRQDRGMPEFIAVDFSDRGKPRMESCGGTGRPQHAEFWGQSGVQSRTPASCLTHPAKTPRLIRLELEMHGLAERMDSCIRPAGAVQHNALPDDAGHGGLETILHGLPATLALPAAKGRAVVGNKETDLHSQSDALRIEPVLQDLDGSRLINDAPLLAAVTPRLLQAAGGGGGGETLIPEDDASLGERLEGGGERAAFLGGGTVGAVHVARQA